MQTFAIFSVRILVGNRLLNVPKGTSGGENLFVEIILKEKLWIDTTVEVVECLINKYLRTIIRQ